MRKLTCVVLALFFAVLASVILSSSAQAMIGVGQPETTFMPPVTNDGCIDISFIKPRWSMEDVNIYVPVPYIFGDLSQCNLFGGHLDANNDCVVSGASMNITTRWRWTAQDGYAMYEQSANSFEFRENDYAPWAYAGRPIQAVLINSPNQWNQTGWCPPRGAPPDVGYACYNTGGITGLIKICKTAVPPECTNGQMMCANEHLLKKCVYNKWENYELCSDGCNPLKNFCYSLTSDIAINGANTIDFLEGNAGWVSDTVEEEVNSNREDEAICAVTGALKSLLAPYISPPEALSPPKKLLAKYFTGRFWDALDNRTKEALTLEGYSSESDDRAFKDLRESVIQLNDTALTSASDEFITDVNYYFDNIKFEQSAQFENLDTIIQRHAINELLIKSGMLTVDVLLILTTGGAGGALKVGGTFVLKEVLKGMAKECTLGIGENERFIQEIIIYNKGFDAYALEKATTINETLTFITNKLNAGDTNFPQINIIQEGNKMITIENEYGEEINVTIAVKGTITGQGYCGSGPPSRHSESNTSYTILIDSQILPEQQKTISFDVPQIALDDAGKINLDELCSFTKMNCEGTVPSQIKAQKLNDYYIEVYYGKGEAMVLRNRLNRPLSEEVIQEKICGGTQTPPGGGGGGGGSSNPKIILPPVISPPPQQTVVVQPPSNSQSAQTKTNPATAKTTPQIGLATAQKMASLVSMVVAPLTSIKPLINTIANIITNLINFNLPKRK